MDKGLRLYAAEAVIYSKMSKPAKLQMLEFIQHEATDSQIKALLLDGKIVYLDEQAEEIVNERFENITEGGWKTIAGMFLGGPGFWAAYRALRAAVDRKSAQCGAFAIGRKRDVCLWKLKAEEAKKLAQLYQKNIKDCVKASNPAKCKADAQKMIQKQLAKAKKYEDKIKTYASKTPQKDIKAKAGLTRAKDKSMKLVGSAKE